MKKNIILFGGSGLIGSRIYKNLIKQNHNVIIADTKKAKGLKNNFHKVNAEKEFEVKKILHKILKKYKKIDVVINSIYPSGVKKKTNFFHENKNNFLKKINSQLGAAFLINQIFINYFKKNRIEGNIIHISSIYGNYIPRFELYNHLNFDMPLDYLISKSSLNYLTKYLSKILLGTKIRINNISPGGIFDNQNKKFVKRYSKFTNYNSMLNVDDVIGVIDFLISSKNKKITGQNISIDDGFTL